MSAFVAKAPAEIVLSPQDEIPEFLRAALAGLSASQKFVPGKYLWDDLGSAIFDEICQSEFYYPTRCEMTLLNEAADQIASIVGANSCIIEAGSGASHKIRVLLDALKQPKRYIAVDISREFLNRAAAKIKDDYTALEVMTVCADYSKPLPSLPIDRSGQVLALFLGISVGNISRDEAVQLLINTREAIGSGFLLIGQDPNHNASIIEKAYGGPLMASFHKNLLVRMIRELGAEIVLDDFKHEARFFTSPARTEPHLVVQRSTAIMIGNQKILLAAGETIRTDVSWKYTQQEFLDLLSEAGWSAIQSWTDAQGLFCLHLLSSEA